MNDYKSLKDHVYDYLSSKISDGSIKPHSKIYEKNIMDDLNISRTPVREALIQLSSDGYIENIPRKGFVVREITLEKAMEVYELIGVLDSYAAGKSLKSITNDDIDSMKSLHSAMEIAIDSSDLKSYYDLQIKFHDIYIDKCENQEIIVNINSLRKKFIRQSYDIDDHPNFKTVLSATNSEHAEIIQLFENRNKDSLIKFIKEIHWDNAYSDYDAVE